MRQTNYNGNTMYHWDSVSEFARAIDSHPNASHKFYSSGHFTDYQNWSEAVASALAGDTSLVPEARALMDQIYLGIESADTMWDDSVAGAYPIVPEYLAGHPEHMRELTEEPSETAPIRIWISLNSSGNIDSSLVAKRGMAYLALAMKLCERRPVELYAFVGFLIKRRTRNPNHGHIIPIPTKPLNLAVACHVLTSNSLKRGLMHQWFWDVEKGSRNSIPPAWTSADTHDERMEYINRARVALGASEEDIIAPRMSSRHEKALTDPVGFVTDTLKEIEERFQS